MEKSVENMQADIRFKGLKTGWSNEFSKHVSSTVLIDVEWQF